MRPCRRLTLPALALVALSTFAFPSVSSAAGRSDYTLHVRAENGDARGIDLSLPWKSSHGGSPFDFTASSGDEITIAKLRFAWAALHQIPEGQPVTITTRGDKMKATRLAGYLVLEPQPPARHHRTRIKIPDYIVDAVLAHDGRLTDEDLDHLLTDRGKITLVKVNSSEGGVNVWIGRTSDDELD